MPGKLSKLMLVMILQAAGFSLSAEDWPQWRGPGRDGAVPKGQAVPEKLPDSLKPVWKLPQGDGVSSPVVSGGKVLCIDHQDGKEVVHAIDAATGTIVWDSPLDQAHKDSQSKPGPRCTPMVDGDRVYVQSCRGQLKCLNIADGKVIWEKNYVKDFGANFTGESGQAPGASRHGNTGSPLVDGDDLIVEVGGVPDASIVCFNKKTGEVKWKSENHIPGYAAPIVTKLAGRQQIVCFMADVVMGLDRNGGKLLWSIPVKTAFARHVTTPVVVDDMVCVASHQFGLIGIKVTADGDKCKAETIWTQKDSALNFSSPVVVGQHLYGLGPSKNLICVDIPTGKQMWSKDGFTTGSAGKAHVGMIVAGANLMVLTDDGQLVLVKTDPMAYHEVSRVRVCASNWCNPAYADGKLYLRDEKQLICLQLIGK